MAVSGLSFRNAMVGSVWATTVPLCMNGLTKQSSRLACHPFLPGSFFLSLCEWLLAECHYYCKLVNGWVWFESRTCRGWL